MALGTLIASAASLAHAAGWHDNGGAANWQVWPSSNYWKWATNLYLATDLWSCVDYHILTNEYPDGDPPLITTNRVEWYIVPTNPASETATFTYPLWRTNGGWQLVNVAYTSTVVATATQMYLNVREMWGYDIYHALRERIRVQTGVAAQNAKFYKAQRDNLVSAKAAIEDIVTSFCDRSQADANGVYDTNGIVMLTVTGLLTQCGLPTNYFAYTPWKALNESEYGMQGCYTCLNSMVWTRDAAFTWDYPNDEGWLGFSGTEASWADAIADAEASWAAWGSEAHVNPYRGTRGFYDGNWDATAYSVTGRWALAHNRTPTASSNLASQASIYSYGVPFYATATPTNRVWDAQGDAATQGWFRVGEASVITAYDGLVTEVFWGRTNFPAWLGDPAVVGEHNYGYLLSDSDLVFKWDVTNGFQYVP